MRGGAINPTLRRGLEYIPGVVAAILVALAFKSSLETYVMAALVAIVCSALVAGYHELRQINEEVEDAHALVMEVMHHTEQSFSEMSQVWADDLQSLAEAVGEETHELAVMIANQRYGEDE